MMNRMRSKYSSALIRGWKFPAPSSIRYLQAAGNAIVYAKKTPSPKQIDPSPTNGMTYDRSCAYKPGEMNPQSCRSRNGIAKTIAV